MDISKLCDTLTRKRYHVQSFPNRHEAADYVNRSIDGKTVGFGDSITLTSLNLGGLLATHNTVFDPQSCIDNASFLEVAKASLTADIYVTSVNALAESGEMVNLDGTGNRIAGSLFGHEKVYIIIGKNKIVPSLEEAIARTRNIAAPLNAKRLGLKTPCAKNADKCYDCASPDRICNALTVYINKMSDMKMEVVLINEDLGL